MPLNSEVLKHIFWRYSKKSGPPLCYQWQITKIPMLGCFRTVFSRKKLDFASMTSNASKNIVTGPFALKFNWHTNHDHFFCKMDFADVDLLDFGLPP